MEIKLLHLLSETSNISITELNEKLHQKSLTTLSQIAKINSYHNNLITTKNGKYCLTHKLNWLDKNKIAKYLKDNQLSYQVHILDQIDSTNSYAFRNMDQFGDKTVISTDWQNSGRGRFGRTWLSTIAHDLTVSVIYNFSTDFNIALLPAICAVAINRLLKNHSINNRIKWPNDIYVEKTKVAGILVENLIRGNKSRTVIGIGLNNIANWERNKLLGELIVSLDNIINEFQLFGFALLRREWLDNCSHINCQVTINKEGQPIDNGTHKDLGESGELMLETKNGIRAYSSSAISLIIND